MGAGPAPFSSSSSKGRITLLGASDVRDIAIAPMEVAEVEVLPTNLEKGKERTKRRERSSGSKEFEEKMRSIIHKKTKCSEYSLEALERKANEVISNESGSEELKMLVAEMARRAKSPDPVVENVRAVNSHLRIKVQTMGEKLKKLRKEIKILTKGKDLQQGGDSQEEETTEDVQDSNLKNIYALQMTEMSQQIVEAVDVTLATFLERLILLEGAVERLVVEHESRRMEREETLLGTERENLMEIDERRGTKRVAEDMLMSNEEGKKRQNQRIYEKERRREGRAEMYRQKGNPIGREKNSSIYINIKNREELDIKEVMVKLRDEIDPEMEMGIQDIRIIKNTPNGRIVRIGGKEANVKAKQLLNRILNVTSVYQEKLEVFMPRIKPRRVIIKGSDDTLTMDEVHKKIKDMSEQNEVKNFRYTYLGWQALIEE